MAQDVTVAGASYSDVPAVNLPKTGGGTATYTDVSDTTATASDVAQGTYFYTAAGVRTVGTATGGGTGGVTQDANGYLVLDDEGGGPTPPTPTSSGSMDDPIRFFDYDGTLVASYDAVPSSLPSVPTHTGLTNGAWNYTLAQVTTQFNAVGRCDVGANYETSSGKTEIDVEFVDAARLSPYLRLAPNGTVTVDWGDGSATETVTGTALNSRMDVHHTYASTGRYTITLELTSGTAYAMYGTSNYTLLHANNSSANYNRIYSGRVRSVRLGPDCTIGAYAFTYCMSLKSISLPSTVASIGNYAFRYCYSLRHVTVPSGMESISMYAFNSCYALASLAIPSSVTSTGTNLVENCYTLMSIAMPSGVTSMANSQVYACYSLASLTIPSGVTSIAASAFAGCTGIAEYHFKPTTPPTLANTNAFANIPSDCKIYVPYSADHSVLDDYKTETNWSTYASYMVEEEA